MAQSRDDPPISGSNQDGHPERAQSLRLSWGQRNTIGALLSQVAQAVDLCSATLGITPEQALSFRHITEDVRPEARAALERDLNELIAQANMLATRCGIPAREASVRALLVGAFNTLWSDVEDTRPAQLRGYGPLEPESAAFLESKIAEMAWLCRRLADTLTRAPLNTLDTLDTLDT